MRSLDDALKTYETLAALHALPSKAVLTTAEAALFLRLSPKTLERMRLDGTGPSYIQGGAAGVRGANQKCLYMKEDLLSWQTSNRVSSALEAAIRRGHAFKTLSDLVAEAPFYIDESGVVDGSAEEASLAVVIGRLGIWDIVWLSAVEAATRQWAAPPEHKKLAAVVIDVLSKHKHWIDAAIDATELANGVSRSDR